MYITTLSLAKMTLYALFLGVFLGVAYDVVRITRVTVGVRYGGFAEKSTDKLYEINFPLIGKLKKRGKGKLGRKMTAVFVFSGDLLFFSACGAVFCIFLYYTDSGMFRWQALAAAVLGFFVYYKTVGTLVISSAEIICIFVKIFVRILLKSIEIPIGFMYNIIVKVSKAVYSVTFGRAVKRYRRRKTRAVMRKMLAAAGTNYFEEVWDRAKNI